MSSVSSTPPSSSPMRLVQPATLRGGSVVAAVVAELKVEAAAAAAKPPAAATSNPAPGSKASGAEAHKEDIARQVHELQAKMDKLNPALAFVVDPDSGRALMQLTDRATKEVILQFPTAAALQISKALDQFQKGLLVNRTA